MKNSNIENFFFINNICGSNNRTLNNKIIGMCKFYYSFITAINLLINYFNTKNIYNERYVNITKH